MAGWGNNWNNGGGWNGGGGGGFGGGGFGGGGFGGGMRGGMGGGWGGGGTVLNSSKFSNFFCPSTKKSKVMCPSPN